MEDEVSTCIRTWRKRLELIQRHCLQASIHCGCCRWHSCQTAAWQLACLMGKESASFVRGRISGINYGLCDSWLTGPCWQCLTFAQSILQMKNYVSQEDHLFSVISAETLVLLKNIPARFPAKESKHTQCGHEIQPTISEADPFLRLIHSGVSRDTLSFNPDFQTFQIVRNKQ